jgi:pectin methylesterase-like acyl-CoA thioesterase
MNRKMLLFSLSIVFLLLLTGCESTGAIQHEDNLTSTPGVLFLTETPMLAPSATSTSTVTQTLAPVATRTSTLTPTPTPLPATLDSPAHTCS